MTGRPIFSRRERTWSRFVRKAFCNDTCRAAARLSGRYSRISAYAEEVWSHLVLLHTRRLE